VLATVCRENDPYYLAEYAAELARTFSSAYSELRVVGEEPKMAAHRLGLFKRVAEVLESSLALLGIKTLERM